MNGFCLCAFLHLLFLWVQSCKLSLKGICYVWKRFVYFSLFIFLCVNCCLLVLVQLKIKQQHLCFRISPTQKVSSGEKQVITEPSLGGYFNLLAIWTIICYTVFTFYFSVALGLPFPKPSPILLNYIQIQIKKTLFLYQDTLRSPGREEDQTDGKQEETMRYYRSS